jgi:hypothetical protein
MITVALAPKQLALLHELIPAPGHDRHAETRADDPVRLEGAGFLSCNIQTSARFSSPGRCRDSGEKW